MEGNALDYVDWRGDLSLRQFGLNVVDCLILATLAYVPFDGIVTETIGKGGVTIREVADRLSATRPEPLRLRMPKDLDLLIAAGASERFGDMRLTGYANIKDERQEKQFAAITVDVGNRETVIAYRGTDLSLVGWKEDFNMSFKAPVPSQEEAVSYLESSRVRTKGKLILVGHSKGGNLAAYAAAFCARKTRARIKAVYNFDGPGFTPETIRNGEFAALSDRLHTFVPQSSIIGMLLERHGGYTVVHSSQSGLISQHDTYTWGVTRDDLARLESVTGESALIDRTISEWLSSMDNAQRERFFDALFRIIGASGAKDLTELTEDRRATARAMIQTFKGVDEPTRKMLVRAIAHLVKTAAKNYGEMRKEGRA
jgi:hypothetical protein